MASIAGARTRQWWSPVAAVVIATLALGISLLVPLAFSDPNGVDPYMVRISVTSLVLLTAACAMRQMTGTRVVLGAVAAATVSFTALSAVPQLIVDVFADSSPSGAALNFWASVAQLLVTVLLGLIALRLVPPAMRPSLRLRRFGARAAVVAAGGVALLLLASLALPAEWLGRLALQPVAIARDMPWLGPANVLQAFAQELQFRSLLMGALERVMPQRWANLTQACFFGLAHLAVNYQGPVAPFVPVTIAVGLLFGWIAQRTGSLWPAVIIHAAADMAIAAAVLPGLYGY
jgi:membrane protease YdiL (CAAX protease family)